MSPSHSTHNIADLNVFNSKHDGNFSLEKRSFGVKPLYLQNRFGCKFSAIASLTKRHATFINHVGIIFGLCSKKQVIGIDACRNVAFVENAESERYRSESKLPGYPVGQCVFSWFSVRAFKFPVSFPVDLSRPKPASFSLFDFSKKSFGNRFNGGRVWIRHIRSILEWFMFRDEAAVASVVRPDLIVLHSHEASNA